MVTIKNIGRQECKMIRQIALQALNKELVSYGVEAKTTSGGSFDDAGFNLKVQFSVIGAESREARDFKTVAEFTEGLDPSDLGREITIRTKGSSDRYKIVGYLVKRQKFSLMCEFVKNGKIALFTETAVIKALASEKRAA